MGTQKSLSSEMPPSFEQGGGHVTSGPCLLGCRWWMQLLLCPQQVGHSDLCCHQVMSCLSPALDRGFGSRFLQLGTKK